MKTILYVTSNNIKLGGVQKCIQEWVENFDNKYNIFLFCLGRNENNEYYEKLKNLNIEIVCGNLNLFSKKRYFGLAAKLVKIIKKNDIDIIHINTGLIVETCIVSIIAKVYGIKVISHSHSDIRNMENGFKRVFHDIFRKKIVKNSDKLVSCSLDAGISLFGKRVIENTKFTVIHNGININEYKEDLIIKEKMLKQYNKNKHFVIGYIGAFSKTKNVEFIINIFKELAKIRDDIDLWMIGSGEKYEYINELIIRNNLNKRIILFGERNDANQFLQAMDLLLLPSLHEGFPLVAIESQMAKKPIIVSRNVTKEIIISNLIYYIDLNNKMYEWVNMIINILDNYNEKAINYVYNYDVEFSINNVAKKIENLYETI